MHNNGHSMKVNISQAAKMAQVDRSTFYRHVKEKGISLDKSNPKRPQVDVSELIRAYGSDLVPLEQLQQDDNNKKVLHTTIPHTPIEEQIELHTLREKVKHLEALRETEKRSLGDQIELLKDLLESEKTERNKTTALLTDERKKGEEATTRLSSLEKTVEKLAEQQNTKKKGWWIFGG